MATYKDVHGLSMTATSQEAVDAFDRMVDQFFEYNPQTGAALQEALDIDPDLVMGHCIQGYFLQLMGNADVLDRAEAVLAEAEARAEGATERERTHVAALGAWCRRDFSGALARWESILIDHPRDVFALKLAQFGHLYLGDVANIRDCIARVMPAWDEGVPHYSNVLGMRAFGLEESGDYPAAEAAGKRAIEIKPNDPYAVHAVAHVMEMQDRPREGIDWITGSEPHWADCNNYRYHLWWHCSLYHLDRGDFDEVLRLYDTKIRADQNDQIRDIANAVALLMRLEFRDVDVGDRWTELAEKCAPRINEHLLPFHDTHFLLAVACGGRRDAAERMIDSMQEYVATWNATSVPVMRDVSIPLAKSVLAYCDRDYERAVDLMMPIRYGLQRIGGSHAQRDIYAEMLIESALKGGQHSLARALLAERSALKPGNPHVWKTYARALEGVGDAAGADAALDRAKTLLAA